MLRQFQLAKTGLSLAFSKENHLFIGLIDGQIEEWNLDEFDVSYEKSLANFGKISALCAVEDETFAFTTEDGNFFLFDRDNEPQKVAVKAGENLDFLKYTNGYIYMANTSRNSAWLISGDLEAIWLRWSENGLMVGKGEPICVVKDNIVLAGVDGQLMKAKKSDGQSRSLEQIASNPHGFKAMAGYQNKLALLLDRKDQVDLYNNLDLVHCVDMNPGMTSICFAGPNRLIGLISTFGKKSF